MNGRRTHQEVIEAGDHLFQQLELHAVPTTTADYAMELALDERITNPRGGLQGGLVATLVDVAAGRALMADLPEGSHLTTADLSVHYLRSIANGPARADVTVLRRGRSLAVLRVDVTDAGTGEIAATATVSFSILPSRPAAEGDGARPAADGDRSRATDPDEQITDNAAARSTDGPHYQEAP